MLCQGQTLREVSARNAHSGAEEDEQRLAKRRSPRALVGLWLAACTHTLIVVTPLPLPLQAYEATKRARPSINPNDGFKKALMQVSQPVAPHC